MNRIVISHRRGDSDAIASRVCDRLAIHYGAASVTLAAELDVPLGHDYRAHIGSIICDAQALIAIIGPKWASPRPDGRSIFEGNDPVRLEIETALRLTVPVIPVLVDGTTMPRPSDLPEALQDLASECRCRGPWPRF
jgi:hypothetical protein